MKDVTAKKSTTKQTKKSSISGNAKKSIKWERASTSDAPNVTLEECRYYLILTQDLHYGDVSQLTLQLEEVRKMFDSYASSILTSGS